MHLMHNTMTSYIINLRNAGLPATLAAYTCGVIDTAILAALIYWLI